MYTTVNPENVQDDPLIAVVVDVDVILGRAAELAAIFLPVVDGLRERRDDALENRLTTARLSHTTIWHRYLRSDCTDAYKYDLQSS